jgi:hypothetical protein
MPAIKPGVKEGSYDIYPAFDIGEGKISRGLSSIAEVISSEDLRVSFSMK